MSLAQPIARRVGSVARSAYLVQSSRLTTQHRVLPFLALYNSSAAFSTLNRNTRSSSSSLQPFQSLQRNRTQQIRNESIFSHRWFHPEPKPGEPPKTSYRVFWTFSAFLLGLSAVYVGFIDPWVQKTFLQDKIKAAQALKNAEPVFDKDEFRPFVIKAIKDYNHNTKLITFSTPGQPTNLPVASALFARPAEDPSSDSIPKDDKGNPVVRWYTPVSDASVPGEFTVMVKKYDTGKLTPYIHSLKVGDSLAFKGPIKKWSYKTNEFSHVGLIGGGSGITPLYQIVTHALRDPNNTTKFTLLYGNVSEKDILLKEDFDNLKKKYPNNFDVVYFVDKKIDKNAPFEEGFITKDAILKYFGKSGASPEIGEKIKVFVCGPPPQMKAISGPKAGFKQGELQGSLKEAGFEENQVYKF